MSKPSTNLFWGALLLAACAAFAAHWRYRFPQGNFEPSVETQHLANRLWTVEKHGRRIYLAFFLNGGDRFGVRASSIRRRGSFGADVFKFELDGRVLRTAVDLHSSSGARGNLDAVVRDCADDPLGETICLTLTGPRDSITLRSRLAWDLTYDHEWAESTALPGPMSSVADARKTLDDKALAARFDLKDIDLRLKDLIRMFIVHASWDVENRVYSDARNSKWYSGIKACDSPECESEADMGSYLWGALDDS